MSDVEAAISVFRSLGLWVDPLEQPPTRPADASPPAPAPIPQSRRTEAEYAPWRAVARACPWRVALTGDMALAYRSCQCKEPADCLLGKATVRPWVGLDTECRTCVEEGGPPQKTADFA